MKNVIYGLVDPITNELRYIGKAKNALDRFHEHMRPRNLVARTHKNNWLNSLVAQGLKPELIIIEECPDMFSMDEAEDFWIQYYKSIGARLTNSCNGGKGTPGFRHREETIQRLSEMKKGTKRENFVPHNKQEHVFVEGKELRLCTVCKEHQPIELFHKNKLRGTFQTGCKPCRAKKQAALRANNPMKLSPEEFKATYINRKKRTDPISEEQKQLLREKRSKPLIATNIETGEVLEFASALEAKKQGFQNTNIGQAIKHNKIYRGYVWKFKS